MWLKTWLFFSIVFYSHFICHNKKECLSAVQIPVQSCCFWPRQYFYSLELFSFQVQESIWPSATRLFLICPNKSCRANWHIQFRWQFYKNEVCNTPQGRWQMLGVLFDLIQTSQSAPISPVSPYNIKHIVFVFGSALASVQCWSCRSQLCTEVTTRVLIKSVISIGAQ